MRFVYKFLLNLLFLYALSLVNVELEHTSLPTTKELLQTKELTDGRSNQCRKYSHIKLVCNYNFSCVYGSEVELYCIDSITNKNCTGSYTCAFCYQLPANLYTCARHSNCQLNSVYKTSCTVHENVACLGHRSFSKNVRCENLNNYKWSYALFLSITLGGFGIDRFYLGNWQEGVGKLFSFGGLGVWTLIDVILVATGYLKPMDGSIMI